MGTNRSESTWLLKLAGGAIAGIAALAIIVAERRRPLRRRTQNGQRRVKINIVLGVMSMLVVALLEHPVAHALARQAVGRRRGLVQLLPAHSWLRDGLAFLLMDYTMYLWHVATHKVPLLWRFHLVHHVDLDLDASTALRFHAADMAISTPYRAAQVALLGVSPRALKLWQAWFFVSVLFHHSNLRLPSRWEKRVAQVITTPRMHGIHHSAIREEMHSNWSSGLSVWDHLHRTFRLDVPQEIITIGVPAYRDPAELTFAASLRLPFVRQRHA